MAFLMQFAKQNLDFFQDNITFDRYSWDMTQANKLED